MKLPHAPRVAVIEDHLLLAQALHLTLRAEGLESELVPVPNTPSAAEQIVAELLAVSPDVVLLDLDLGAAGDGAELIQPLTEAGMAVVVVTGDTSPSRWGQCLSEGAATVLPKASALETIVDVARRAAAGDVVLNTSRRTELVQTWFQHRSQEVASRTRLSRLTPREGEVLQALVTGKRVRDIATESFVSEATVRTQVKSILVKLGVTSQLAAVALAREAGRGVTT